ncbi:S8 family serine peptidase [Nodularia sp. NIES-3585]|uniref:S8 family serine peptidase n=1 Tax=Nodularia sp. NIES-3585 TaxID=1973477 RepID=UPI000B5C5627|nr:S8 family serine peptidase [Nodularia sp. NIES-3585]GAX36843.1 minor extracellular protease Epr [Nodularia sp. NIES-3585]
MKHQKSSLFSTAIAVAFLASGGLLMFSSAAKAAEEEVVAKKTRVIAGQEYTFVKYADRKGNIRSEVRNPQGSVINEKAIPQGKTSPVEPRVLNLMAQVQNSGREETIKINVALNLPVEETEISPESGEVESLNNTIGRVVVNGREISKAELRQQAQENTRLQRGRSLQIARIRGEKLSKWAKRYGLEKKEGIQAAIAQGRAGVTLDLTVAELKKLIESQDPIIEGIELFETPKDTISQAMVATSISSSALPYSTTRGNGIGIYMTESGCADPSRITNYNRLSGTETDHSRNVGGILRAVSPGSFIYCRGSAVLPQSGDLGGVNGNPAIRIVTRSNGGNDTTSYNTVDRDWDNFIYDNNIPAFLSAGNNGNGTGNVGSPAKGLNVITVGNYNDANATISSSSSFVDPETRNSKPEISAPGTNITAGGFTMSGTSMSAPHAAAFLADMMSDVAVLQNRPYLAKANLLAGATDAITGGSDKVGLGGIDFASAHWSGYWNWYYGNNNSFTYFDEQDGTTDGYVEKLIYISNSWPQVKTALSWLNRGNYTYSHRTDAHPIGMDLDLQIYDPNGNFVGGSYSFDNPFESVNFIPTTSGYYKFRIKRYANRDTSSNLGMGLYVNYYNP